MSQIFLQVSPTVEAKEVIEVPAEGHDHITQILEYIGNENPTLGSYIEFILAFFVLFFGIAPKCGKFFLWLFSLYRDKQVDNWEAIANFNRELEEIIDRLKADQGYLVKSHNGGGVPTIGQKCYLTVTNSVGARTRNGSDLWDSIPIDTCYSNLLIKLLKEQCVLVVADDLPTSDLKIHYEQEGVVFSIMYLLRKGRKEVLFLNYTFKKSLPSEDELSKLKSEMRIRGKKLNSIFPKL